MIRLALLVGVACAALLSLRSQADAAILLQLPWPTGEVHRIGSGGYSYNCGSTHTGSNQYAIDFDFPTVGQSVAVTAPGTIVAAVDNDENNGGRGNYLEVDHGNGFRSRYLHLRHTGDGPTFPSGIHVGAQVTPGVAVAYSGNTPIGIVGAHLHFDLKLNTGAYRPEPMSRVTGGSIFGDAGFGKWGLCTGQASSYWTSWPPYATIDGALVQGSGDPVYIISGGQKRWITTSTVFSNCGYKTNEKLKLPDSAMNLIPTGSNIASGPPCPQTLAAAPGTNPVYAIFNSWKRHISSPTVFNGCGYQWNDVVSSPLPSGTSLPVNGPPCPYTRDPWYNTALIDGTLVASGNPLYVISGGLKRWIVNPSVRDACGYKTNDVINISSIVLNLIPTGPDITAPPCPHTMFKGSSSAVYVMESQYKRHITSPAVLDACGYVPGEVVQLTDTQVNSVPSTTALSSAPCPFTRQ